MFDLSKIGEQLSKVGKVLEAYADKFEKKSRLALRVNTAATIFNAQYAHYDVNRTTTAEKELLMVESLKLADYLILKAE